MSTIKGEVAAFIADHQVDNFVMTPVTMREISLRTAQEQMLPKVEMERIVDGVLEGCPVYPVPVRVYIPDTSRPLPVLIYYHAAVLSSIRSRSMIRLPRIAKRRTISSSLRNTAWLRKILTLQPMTMPWPWPKTPCLF